MNYKSSSNLNEKQVKKYKKTIKVGRVALKKKFPKH